MQNSTEKSESIDNDAPAAGATIDILLPVKERFSHANAGAVAGVVHELATYSRQSSDIRVIGAVVEDPLPGTDFVGLTPRRAWLTGRNLGFANAYLHMIRDARAPRLVEVHARCHVAAHIAKKRPDIRVALYLHNDPREMKGAKSTGQRMAILNAMSAVICVSDYIKQCFLDGLDTSDELRAKVHTVRNGTVRWLTHPNPKKRLIFMAGRMVPEKGILECARALAVLLPHHEGWRVVVAGAKRFQTAKLSRYEREVAKALGPIGRRAVMTGHIGRDEVRRLQQEAEIIVCPSIWQEPISRAVLEALAAGSALLTTRRGGIPEVAEGRAHIVDNTGAVDFAKALERMITDDAYRKSLQERAWNDFPFTAEAMAHEADQVRARATGR